MPSEPARTHWLYDELFREPQGGRAGWALLAFVIVFVAYEIVLANYWVIPLVVVGVAEVLPEERARTAGLLRSAALLYLLLYGLGTLLLLVVG